MPLIGQSPEICRVRVLVEKLARSRVPVLILGESGTGKEVAARAIYDARPQGHFITIDCAGISPTLIESELFGHTRGAFTGAGENRPGLVEAADGGTAFFDEIGELRTEMQTRLLRLIQEREFRPVGAQRARHVDIRVIAATNRDLQAEMTTGRFREDLYHRLNVVSLHLPPLREHKSDIALLVAHFLRECGGGSLDSAAMDAMLAYDWPGNVRELRNTVQRMSALISGSTMQVGDLPTSIQHYLASRDLSTLTVAVEDQDMDGLPVESRGPAIMPLAAVEKQMIIQTLRFTRGDRAKAAQMLGIGRTTLYRKIKEYRIEI